MIKKATKLLLVGILTCLFVPATMAQQTEYSLTLSTDVDAGYTTGLQSGARDIAGPFDLDGDGLSEILVADYTAGGRVHVIENVGADTWELVYSTPFLDSTGTTNNIRAIAGGDLDGDQNGEIMFLAGRGYSDTNPNIGDLPVGLYVFEAQGNNDFGTAAASIYEFPEGVPDRWRAEQIDVMDVDGDNQQELFFGNNGSNNIYDNWYVLSVNGDIGSNFETWVEELRLTSRSDSVDAVARGGGSAYAIHPADLDGDGDYELSLHSWNNFNISVYDTDGSGGYAEPNTTGDMHFLNAAPADQVSFFGGVVVDIDDNGDHEVFYPNLQTGNIAIVNYENGEDPLSVTADNVILDVIPGLSSLGITAADLDGDGQYELIGTGPGYAGSDFEAGSPAEWINLVEFNGGDPEDPSSYSTVTAVASPMDTYNGFHTVNWLDGTVQNIDNALDVSIRDTVVINDDNPEFASKLTFLGDPDLDGVYEIAFGIQGVRDSLYTLTQQAPDSNFVIDSVVPNENRTFLRVMSTGGNAVSIDDERIVLPNDYQLHANYPNPFNPTTTISFTLPLERSISVKVFDITGRLIKTLVNNEIYPQGTFEVTWDGTSAGGGSVASGTYLYTLEYGNFRQTRKMTLIK